MEHIRYWAAGVGAALGDFFGGMDGLLTVLVAFVVLDYITGVLCAVIEKCLSSETGFKGICQKVMIFCLVGYGEPPRHADHRQRQHAQNRRDFLLLRQRRHLHHRKRRAHRPARAGEAKKGHGATEGEVNAEIIVKNQGD